MINTKEDFLLLIKQIEQKSGYKKPKAFGIARLDRGQLNKNKILQASFALINYEQNFGSAAIMLEAFMQRGVEIDFNASEFVQTLKLEDIDFALSCFKPFLEEEGHQNIDLLKIIKDKFKDDEFAFVCLFEDKEPLSVESVYLKLYLLSTKSYVNFNAGTTGACMVEGRISSSAIVGEGSDVGGGASILGVLSGTSGNAISVGKACLLGANSVTGIPLGDNCIVDAGIAVLEGTKFLLKDAEELAKLNPYFDFSKEIYKGIELKGLNGLHFRQDSISGAMIVSLNKKAIKLNEALH
ncbi:tetrahydrodipicolinate N-succinyltransferase N-terminal domain-containing protein [Campylobacter coli]|nr:tetrahydrodipicolinate N-succinyltransferase N-terminal domain-containing protein [Campylobacter coli]